SGHTAAAPPSSVIKSRRLNGSNCIDARQPDPIRKLSYWRGCVRWHGSYFTTREPVLVRFGHSRRSRLSGKLPHVRLAPKVTDALRRRERTRCAIFGHASNKSAPCTSRYSWARVRCVIGGNRRQMHRTASDHALICRGCWDQMGVPIPIRGPLAVPFRIFGVTQSKMNPNICTICERAFRRVQKHQHVTAVVTILFADIRGYTRLSERM